MESPDSGSHLKSRPLPRTESVRMMPSQTLRKVAPAELSAILPAKTTKFMPEDTTPSSATEGRRPSLPSRIWNHRLRTPFLYALFGITLTAAANIFEAYRIYRMQGDLILPEAPTDRRPTGARQESDPLVRLRNEFNRQNYAIENEMKVRERNWPYEYTARLQALQDAFRDKGDFMGWMDIKRERERFDSQQAVFEAHLVKSPEELRKLQLEFNNIVARYEADMLAALDKNYNEYLADLDALRRAQDASATAETIRAIDVEIEFMRRYKNRFTSEPLSEAAQESDETEVEAASEANGGDPPAQDPAAVGKEDA